MMPNSSTTTPERETIQRFEAFAAAATRLFREDHVEAIARFNEFVVKAKQIVLVELPRTIAELRPLRNALDRWLLPTELDLLRIASVTWDEDAYTNLLAWWLRPSTDPQTAIARQSAFVRALKLDGQREVSVVAEPQLRILTEDGIPDLVLAYPEFVIVVEAKTGTLEHQTPGGLPQTLAYHSAVRRSLRIPDATPIHTVFLTIDRSPAANEEATNVSFLDCIVAIALRFKPSDFGEHLGSLIQVWLSHLLHEAMPPRMNIAPLISQTARVDAVDESNVGVLLSCLHTITLLHEALQRHIHE